MVKMDLLQDDHHSLVSLTHTFANGEGGLLQMQVPADIGQPNITRFTLLVHGLSGVYFQQHARLNYDSGTVPKRFAVHIQLDKADPKGNHMKKLANVTSGTYGVLEDFMLMDEEPVLGTWLVESRALRHRYDGVEYFEKLNGNAKFTIPFDQLLNEVDPYSYQPLVEKLAGYQLIIRVKVTESLNNVTREATGSVLFYKEPFTVSFARDSSPTFFKPGLPYVGHIKLTQADGRPVISNATDVLLRSYVKFYDKSHGKYRAHTLPDKHFAPSPTGIIEFMVDPPENATSLHLQVEYKGLTDTYDMTKPSWLIENGNLQLSQVNSSMIGEVVDFQLLGAVPLGKVFYYVITNDHVTLSGALDSVSKTEHIHFQVRDDMKPYSKLIVYYFTTDSWNADSIHFVAKTSADVFQNKISMSFDKTQAEPAENVSLQISTDADSLVNILAVDQSVLLL
ncbi:CD109-like protein, partial [Mya arenaria]